MRRVMQWMVSRLPGQTLARRVRWDLCRRPDYAYGVYHAAQQAAALGVPGISALEFGVAGGNGLLALEAIAAEVTAETGVKVETYGFDGGAGMPEPKDYRDSPYLWQRGFFQMDVDALRRRLRSSVLVLGPFTETVPRFVVEQRPAPIGFISFDADYYTSTMQAFRLFDEADRFFLPRSFCYFDDVIGGDWELHSEYTGELLAIEEFNRAHADRKIARIHGLAHKRLLPAWWHDAMFVHHRFAHPLYNRHVHPEKDWQLHLTPERPARSGTPSRIGPRKGEDGGDGERASGVA